MKKQLLYISLVFYITFSIFAYFQMFPPAEGYGFAYVLGGAAWIASILIVCILWYSDTFDGKGPRSKLEPIVKEGAQFVIVACPVCDFSRSASVYAYNHATQLRIAKRSVGRHIKSVHES